MIDFALKAAEEAVANCGVHPIGAIPAERWGVVIGTCNAGLLAAERWYSRKRKGEDPRPAAPAALDPQAPGRGARVGVRPQGARSSP